MDWVFLKLLLGNIHWNSPSPASAWKTQSISPLTTFLNQFSKGCCESFAGYLIYRMPIVSRNKKNQFSCEHCMFPPTSLQKGDSMCSKRFIYNLLGLHCTHNNSAVENLFDILLGVLIKYSRIK